MIDWVVRESIVVKKGILAVIVFAFSAYLLTIHWDSDTIALVGPLTGMVASYFFHPESREI